MAMQCGFIAGDPGSITINSKDISSSVPVPISSSTTLTSIYSGGWGYGIASTTDAKLFSWGINQATILKKSGLADDGADPCTLDQITPDVIDSAASGFDFILVVHNQGQSVSIFGPATSYPPIALPHSIIISAVAAGEHHSLLLASTGDVYAFGDNREHQLGIQSNDGGVNNASILPKLVLGPSSNSPHITAVACGSRHSLAIDSNGRCYAWGWSIHGQCGVGTELTPTVERPRPLDRLGPLCVTSIAGGMMHSLVCTDSGDVYSFGGNDRGQLGHGTTENSLIPKLVESREGSGLDSDTAIKVSAGARHSVVLCGSGAVYCFGFNGFGQLGIGTREDAWSPKKIESFDGKKVKDAVAGWWHTLFLVDE